MTLDIDQRAAQALIELARRIPSTSTFEDAARLVFDSCKQVLGATGGYVAMVSSDGKENEVLFLDSGGEQCTVDPKLPMPIRGLRQVAYERGRAVLENDFSHTEWQQFIPEGHSRLENVLFAPILIDGAARGLIGLANKPGGFAQRDAEIAESFAALAALALRAEADRRLLAESEQMAHQLSQHTGAFLWRLSVDERWEYVSPSVKRVRGFSATEAMGQSLEEAFAPASLQIIREQLRNGGRGGTVELEMTHQNGSTVWVDALSTPTLDPRAGPTGLAGICLDISERKDLEEQLRHAQKMEALGQLAAGVTHDFGNHLAAILLLTGLAIDETAADDPRRLTLERVRAAAADAANLTDQLLAFSRRQTLEATRLDLNEVVLAHIDVIRRTLRENIAVSRSLEATELNVVGDTAKLQQVLMNLSLNAQDAMPDGGQLAFSTCGVLLYSSSPALDEGMRPGPYAQLRIVDTGEGMTEEVAQRAFEPFFTTKDVGKGTGLGLSTVFGVVRQLGGAVRINTRVGEGTDVTLYLPLAGSPRPSPSTDLPGELPRGTETLLLIEDDDILRETLRRVLQHLGYRVVVADSVNEACVAVERHAGPIDLVVSDVVLPDASASVIVKRLQAYCPSSPVLFVSGHAPHVLEGVGIGSDREILRKPFGPPDIARKIRDILDR